MRKLTPQEKFIKVLAKNQIFTNKPPPTRVLELANIYRLTWRETWVLWQLIQNPTQNLESLSTWSNSTEEFCKALIVKNKFIQAYLDFAVIPITEEVNLETYKKRIVDLLCPVISIKEGFEFKLKIPPTNK